VLMAWRASSARPCLTGRVAIVTGARVKIGYRIALKLLRCGAAVVATTRFPVRPDRAKKPSNHHRNPQIITG